MLLKDWFCQKSYEELMTEEFDDSLISHVWISVSERTGINRTILEKCIVLDEGICTTEVRHLENIIKEAKNISSCTDARWEAMEDT